MHGISRIAINSVLAPLQMSDFIQVYPIVLDYKNY